MMTWNFPRMKVLYFCTSKLSVAILDYRIALENCISLKNPPMSCDLDLVVDGIAVILRSSGKEAIPGFTIHYFHSFPYEF